MQLELSTDHSFLGLPLISARSIIVSPEWVWLTYMMSSLSYATYFQLRFTISGYISSFALLRKKRITIRYSFDFIFRSQRLLQAASFALFRVVNMSENGDAPAVVVPESTNESNGETSTPAPTSAPTNDRKLLLTVIKYDFRMGKLLPGGKLAPTPSQLDTSKLGIIRAQLSKDGYLEKAEWVFVAILYRWLMLIIFLVGINHSAPRMESKWLMTLRSIIISRKIPMAIPRMIPSPMQEAKIKKPKNTTYTS